MISMYTGLVCPLWTRWPPLCSSPSVLNRYTFLLRFCENFFQGKLEFVAAATAGQRQGHRSLWPSGLVPGLESTRHRVRRPNTPTWAAQTEFYFWPAYRFNRPRPWNRPPLFARPRPQPTTERATLQRPPPLPTTAKTTHVSPLQLLLVARLASVELTTSFHCSPHRPTTISTRHDHIEASQHRILVRNRPFQLITERFLARALLPFLLQRASLFSISRAKF